MNTTPALGTNEPPILPTVTITQITWTPNLHGTRGLITLTLSDDTHQEWDGEYDNYLDIKRSV